MKRLSNWCKTVAAYVRYNSRYQRGEVTIKMAWPDFQRFYSLKRRYEDSG